MLGALAKHRGMSCEALTREYITRGVMEDRLRMLADSAVPTVESVLREHAPETADPIMAEVRRRFRDDAQD